MCARWIAGTREHAADHETAVGVPTRINTFNHVIKCTFSVLCSENRFYFTMNAWSNKYIFSQKRPFCNLFLISHDFCSTWFNRHGTLMVNAELIVLCVQSRHLIPIYHTDINLQVSKLAHFYGPPITCINTCIYTNIHTHMHTYIHTHTYITLAVLNR